MGRGALRIPVVAFTKNKFCGLAGNQMFADRNARDYIPTISANYVQRNFPARSHNVFTS